MKESQEEINQQVTELYDLCKRIKEKNGNGRVTWSKCFLTSKNLSLRFNLRNYDNRVISFVIEGKLDDEAGIRRYTNDVFKLYLNMGVIINKFYFAMKDVNHDLPEEEQIHTLEDLKLAIEENLLISS